MSEPWRWRAVVLRHFEEEMQTVPKIHALIAIPYVRTELQLRRDCTTGLTMEKYDSEERKKVEGREKSLDDESERPYDL